MTVQQSAGLSPAAARLRSQVAIAARSLSIGGHDDFNQGQVSARMPGADTMLIKGALTGFDECRPDDVLVVSNDFAAPVPSLAPPEIALHQAVYNARPDVNAVVHSHAPYTLVFGATDLEIRAVSHDGAWFEGRLGRFTMTSNTILDAATGQAVAKSLAGESALFLRNHGGLVAGRSIRHATVVAHLLERACRLQMLAEQVTSGYHSATVEDIASKREFIYGDLAIRSYWDYCVRQVVRRWPEAAGWLGPASAVCG